MTRLGSTTQPFDHLIVSGDISTDGSEPALRIARRVIEEEEIIESKRLLLFGLHANIADCTTIPGNHDRYSGWLPIQRHQRNFEAVFPVPVRDGREYPRVELVKAPTGSNRPDLLIFAFDSTQTLRIRDRFTNPFARIARGEVTVSECEWLLRESRKIAIDKAVNGNTLRLDNCVRIAVLHHHPILPEGASARRLTSMDNDELFRERCLEAGMNMVLFGHQHLAYARTIVAAQGGTTPFGASAPVHLFCCASTAEYSETDSGFYIYDIDVGGVDAYQFDWLGGGFSTQPVVMRRDF